MHKQKIDKYVEENKEEILKDLAELIKIPSLKSSKMEEKPFGEKIDECLNKAIEIASSYDLKTKNYDSYIAAVDIGEGEAKLDILTHLDVVPAGDNWQTDPFEMTQIDNRIFGRGVIDNKGPAIAVVWAMKAIKDLEIPIKNRVRLLFGTDEESGFNDIKYYYDIEEEAEMTFTPDALFPVVNVEKGRKTIHFYSQLEFEESEKQLISFSSGIVANTIPDSAKAVLKGVSKEELIHRIVDYTREKSLEFGLQEMNENIEIIFIGKSGHGSMPANANNALTALLEFLSKLPLDESNSFQQIKKLSKLFPHGDYLGQALGLAESDDLSGDLTMSLNMFNFMGKGMGASLDCRTIVSTDEKRFDEVLFSKLKNAGFDISFLDSVSPHHVEEESELVQTLLQVYENYSGQTEKPIAIGGNTYAHFTKRGVAFGCGKADENNNMHGANEFIYEEKLYKWIKIFADVIIKLCCK